MTAKIGVIVGREWSWPPAFIEEVNDRNDGWNTAIKGSKINVLEHQSANWSTEEGKTVTEIREALRKHLSRYFDSPEVSVDVIAYNSKVFYVITQGAGLGDNVRRVPVTGNDTVLDALSMVNGLSPVSSTTIMRLQISML